MKKIKEKPKSTKWDEDIKSISVPFDLFTGLSLVTEELKKKDFTYTKMVKDHSPILIFESKKLEERVSIVIEKENLLIRHFIIKNDTRKLKVLYVLKPSERKFKLV